jgi:hypothetical protein
MHTNIKQFKFGIVINQVVKEVEMEVRLFKFELALDLCIQSHQANENGCPCYPISTQ